jgi:sulfur carrier protein
MRLALEVKMRLTVNGEERLIDGVADIAALISALGLDRRKLAVERNLAIVPRSAYASTRLFDGDRIEIVAFVGGG